jgi:O-antigen/teichoic acid export membrane protein
MTSRSPNAEPEGERTAGRVARSFLALGLGEALSRLIAFGAMVYAARVLGAGPYGTIGVAVAVVLYLNRVVDAGFELGLGVREIAASPAFLVTSVPSVLWARTLLAVVLAGVTTAVALVALPRPDGPVLGLASWGLLAVGFGSRWVHLGQERSLLVAVAAVVGQSVMAALVFLLVRGPDQVTAVPAAQAIGDLVVALILAAALVRLGGSLRLEIRWRLLRPLVVRARHLVASALLGLVIYSAGLLFLRVVRDSAHAGHYAAAYALVTFCLNVGVMYNLSLLPSLTKLASEPERQRALYHAAFAQVFAIGLPVAIGGSLLAGGAIGLMYGVKYAAAVLPFAILVWSIPLNLLRDVALMALMSAGLEPLVFRVTAVSAVVSVGLSIAMVPAFGLAGAALATVLAELFRAGLAAFLARSRGFPLPGGGRFAKPVVAGLGMGVAIALAGVDRIWLAIPIGLAAYGGLLAATGGLRIGGPHRLELRV